MEAIPPVILVWLIPENPADVIIPMNSPFSGKFITDSLRYL